jgi:hypothetical protein
VLCHNVCPLQVRQVFKIPSQHHSLSRAAGSYHQSSAWKERSGDIVGYLINSGRMEALRTATRRKNGHQGGGHEVGRRYPSLGLISFAQALSMNHTFNAAISNEIMRMNRYKAAGEIGKLRISAMALALALFLTKIFSRAEPEGPIKPLSTRGVRREGVFSELRLEGVLESRGSWEKQEGRGCHTSAFLLLPAIRAPSDQSSFLL